MGDMSHAFTINPALVLAMLDEIGRTRALADYETDLVEEIVMLGTTPFRWNNRHDRSLLIACHSVGGIARFARRHGITGDAAYSRLKRLRRQARQIATKKRKG